MHAALAVQTPVQNARHNLIAKCPFCVSHPFEAAETHENKNPVVRHFSTEFVSRRNGETFIARTAVSRALESIDRRRTVETKEASAASQANE